MIAFENLLEASNSINDLLTSNLSTRNIVDSLFDAVHRTEEMINLLDWVRKYNRTAIVKVIITGFDLQGYWYIPASLKKRLPNRYSQLIPQLDVIDSLQQRATKKNDFEQLFKLAVQCKQDYLSIRSHIEKKGNESQDMLYLNKSFDQLCNAYKKKLSSIANMTNGSLSWEDDNLRDSLMAENVRWLATSYLPGHKIVLWAHNVHLSKAVNLANADDYFLRRKPMGQYLQHSFKNRYKAYCLLTATGDFTIFNQYGYPAVAQLKQSPEDSYEYFLSQCREQNFYINLEHSPVQAPDAQLFNDLRWRSAGSGGEAGFRFYNLDKNFDGLFFLKSSTHSISIINN